MAAGNRFGDANAGLTGTRPSPMHIIPGKSGKPASILVCVNPISGPNKPCCGGRGSEKLAEAIEKGVRERRIDVSVERIRCLNKCHDGPSMRYAPGGSFMLGVTEADLADILDELEALCGKRSTDGEIDFGSFYPGG